MIPALLLGVLVACGGEPTTPSPQPTPTPVPAPQPQPAPTPAPPALITINGTIVETLTGAPLGTFTQEVERLPASVNVSTPGHITRETRVGSTSPTVDLISTAPPFSSIFYGQLVRNMLESTVPDIVRVLPASPSIYIQTAGLSSADVNSIAQTARSIMPAMTGGRLAVMSVETGESLRPDAAGWITVEIVKEFERGLCGQAYIGRGDGHVWLKATAACLDPGVVRHEFGHALGFRHVDVPSALMNAQYAGGKLPSDAERHHAAIAYARQTGNRDPDSDSPTVTPLRLSSTVVTD
jgi:hypothetical protein